MLWRPLFRTSRLENTKGSQKVVDCNVQISNGRATAVVGPYHVRCLYPQLCYTTVDCSVVGAEGEATRQTSIDGPREDCASCVGLGVDG